MNAPGHVEPTRDDLGRLRKLLQGLFLISTLGIGLELVLLEHLEDYRQRIPLVTLGVGLASAIMAGVRPTRLTLRVHQFILVVFLVSGPLGLYWHYAGNAEFEREMYPTLKGAELFWKSMKGAFPMLAPTVMSQLGMLGLVSLYRHPCLRRRSGERKGKL